MVKTVHEIRDPIHVFVRLSSDERKVLDSKPFQRLRSIHQLALTHLVYPGATHRRFEHSLGVMELADRVFSVITQKQNLTEDVRRLVPEFDDDFEYEYWRRALRMAALCHDLGHLPFSHAAEIDLLPDGWDHEKLSGAIIRSEQMHEIWESMKLNPDDIETLALGSKATNPPDSHLKTLLSDIIVGDAFGVDRIDYLLRDSHHAGVAYGRFDHHRLIDTLRILPSAPEDSGDPVEEPALGVEEGGLQSVEALVLARYFMYSQVYFHPLRRIYDIHLRDFLREWLQGGKFSVDVGDHLKMTDNEVGVALRTAADDPGARGHDAARRIEGRDHYRVCYSRNPNDVSVNPDAGKAVFSAASEKFGTSSVRHDKYSQRGGSLSFPVRMRNGDVVSALAASEALPNLPVVATDYVFIDRDHLGEAQDWLGQNRASVIQLKGEVEDGAA